MGLNIEEWVLMKIHSSVWDKYIRKRTDENLFSCMGLSKEERVLMNIYSPVWD